ncbi:thioester-forming surface-anchored protein [Gemella sp. ND 6198]|uniref:thioester-forming surface-anchored protein n=1 Tax=Gemella sp. ND 6198 TaxID=2040624 RepID=UPI00352EAA7A
MISIVLTILMVVGLAANYVKAENSNGDTGYPNDAVADSADGKYYSAGTSNRLGMVTSDEEHKIAEYFGFCLANGKQFPRYDYNSDQYFGKYERLTKLNKDSLSKFVRDNHTYSHVSTPDDQLWDLFTKLVYIYLKDPTNIVKKAGWKDREHAIYDFWQLIQNEMWRYTDGLKIDNQANQYLFGKYSKEYQKALYILREDMNKITVPMDKFELRGYKPEWHSGKLGYQAILTGRFRETPAKEVQISKVDLAGKELPGAKIQIKKGDEVVDSWTSTNEVHKVNLKEGEYTFHEEAAPNDYTVVTDIQFKVDKDGNVTIIKKETSDTATTENNKLKVTDQKKDIDKNAKLQTTVKVNEQVSTTTKSVEVPENKDGVKVVDTLHYKGLVAGEKYEVKGTIYAVNGDNEEEVKETKTAEFTADASGQGDWDLDFGSVKNLEAGKSYVVYEEVTSKENLVDKDNNGTPDEKQTLEHKDPKDKAQIMVIKPKTEKEVEFSKVNIAGKEIAGAQIEIKQGTTVVEKWTSKENETHKVKLTEGTYTFHEVAAPKGYKVVTDITFTVDKDGKVTVKDINGNTVKAEGNKLTVTDQDEPVTPPAPQPKEVQFSKVNLGGKEIAGAKIQILKDGKVVASWTSVENKTHKLKLAAGTYTFHEEAAPEGYLAVTDITFTVDKDGNVKITNVNGNTAKAEGNKLTVTDKNKPVTPPAPPIPPKDKPKSTLPNTGLADNGMAEVAGGLLLAGAALAYSRRRKG